MAPAQYSGIAGCLVALAASSAALARKLWERHNTPLGVRERFAPERDVLLCCHIVS